VSFIRSYKEHVCNYIFRLKDLDMLRLARAFGLFRVRPLPNGRRWLLWPCPKWPATLFAHGVWRWQLPKMPELRDVRVQLNYDPAEVSAPFAAIAAGTPTHADRPTEAALVALWFFSHSQLDSIAYKDKQREKLRRQKMAQWAANRIAEEEAEDDAEGGADGDGGEGSSSGDDDDDDDAEAGSAAGRARKGVKRAAPWSEQQERKRRREERRAKYGSLASAC